MTPQQAGVSAEAVAKLVEKLRGDIEAARSTGIGQWADIFNTRLDELEAALATAPPEQDNGVAQEEAQLLARYDKALQDQPQAASTAPPEQADVDDERVWTEAYPEGRVLPPTEEHMPKWRPQAVSAGALSAEPLPPWPCLNCGGDGGHKENCLGDLHIRENIERRILAALAAHDQKVRAETLLDASRLISGSCKDDGSETDEALTWAASRIRLLAETGK